MKTKIIEISEITVEELADKVAECLLVKIETYLIQMNKKEEDIYLTRKETAEFLKVSMQGLYHWTKKGILNSYRIGNRVYYKKNELLNTSKKK